MPPRVTIHDVAREAGVSVGTVYRAMQNTGRISGETRARVLDAVKRMEYKPNSVARGLALRSRFTILVALPAEPANFWNDVLKGVRRAAAKLSEFGVRTVEFVHREGVSDGRRIMQVFEEGKVDAVAVSPVDLPEFDGMLRYAAGSGIPAAVFNEETPGAKRMLFYGPDNRLAGRMAAEVLAKSCAPGSVCCAVSSSDYPSGQTEYREAGFTEYFMQRSPQVFGGIHRCAAGEAPGTVERLIRSRPEIGGIYFVQYSHLVESLGVLRKRDRKTAVVGHEYHSRLGTALKNGTVTALLVQEKVCQGYYPLMMLYRHLATGEKPQRDTFYSNINLIMETNLECLLHSESGCGYE